MRLVIVVENDDYHPGQPFTSDDVKAAIEGDGCGAECETRNFKVISVKEN
jgi:hypothetical protein